MKSKTGLWRKMLYAVRAIEGPITSTNLADAANMPVKQASAWLCLLARWGYLRRSGKESIGGRWGFIWKLTRFGVEYRPAKKGGKASAPTLLKIAANPGKKK